MWSMTPDLKIVSVISMVANVLRLVSKTISVIAISLISILLWTSVSSAHDPLFLLPEHQTPSEGPSLPDGTISFAFYGEFLTEGETRGFQAYFADGDFFQLELLIPAMDPEQRLQDNQLPFLRLTSPDGLTQTLYPSIRSRFDEPFTNTSYYTLIQERRTATEGIYDVMIVSRAPARFTSAIGTSEQFGTPVERAGDRPSSFTETAERLDEWYTKSNSESSKKDENKIDASSTAEGSEDVPLESLATESETTSNLSDNELDSSNQESIDLDTSDLASTNQTLWLVIMIAIVAIPVGVAIKRILKSTPK
jgi:hypothetical protein